MPTGRGFGREHLVYPAVPQRLTDGLRTLGQEPARFLALRTPRQAARSNDPGCPVCEQGIPGSGVLGAQADFFTSDGRFCFATSASEVNAAASFTASSARILRSTSTPAALMPWMKRL